MSRAADEGRSITVRPTAFGVTATAVAAAVFAARSSIHDPALAGLVWTVFVGLVVVGSVWPLAVLRFADVEVVDAPTDAVAGVAVPIGIRLRSPGLVDTVALQFEGSDGWWSAPSGTAVVELELPRSLTRAVRVTMSTDGPLGMLSVTRRIEVALDVPIAVGPDPVPQHWEPPVAPESGADDAAGAVTHGGDHVRSVRPYRSGDPAHLVHWPSSARIGSLVVRELEPPTRPGVVIVVDLGVADGADGADGAEAVEAVERAVAEAAGLAAGVLRTGGWVMLCTNHDGRPLAAEVATPLQVQRRLAAATTGPVGRPGGPAGAARPTTIVFGPAGR